MKVINKIVVGAGIVALVTNPLSGQYILWGLDYGFGLIFRYGSPINLVASAIVMVFIGWKIWDSREVTKIPSKTKATAKAGKFIAT